ncbi:type II toxin-antitoxin system VapC family toxin [Caulobacter sp. ErkDOM-E]|uniref:type II toxin-antitoxin system VapC family toxin n=1 Tax=Caulobacter sp. ErkDOM-E TaxID=3402778 RepID=UPI003AF9CE33
MTLVVDASALVAIARHEAGYEILEEALSKADQAFATTVNIMEAGLVLVLRDARFTAEGFQAWLHSQNVVETQIVEAGAALDAYMRWGKGVHRAGLNMGDCFAYALAKTLDAPLLYKGDDFPLTDVRSALD